MILNKINGDYYVRWSKVEATRNENSVIFLSLIVWILLLIIYTTWISITIWSLIGVVWSIGSIIHWSCVAISKYFFNKNYESN